MTFALVKIKSGISLLQATLDKFIEHLERFGTENLVIILNIYLIVVKT